MRIDKRDGSEMRRVLIGMIVSTPVISRVASKWTSKEGMFKSKWANMIGNWCVDYYNRYGKATKQSIEGLFEAWSKSAKDKETVDSIEKFLVGLSGEYATLRQELNSDYVIDLANKHFKRVQVIKHKSQMEGFLDEDELDKAIDAIEKFNKVELGSAGDWIDVLQDTEAIKESFTSKQDPLVTWSGDLGLFFSDSFERDSFICYLGPEKRGKSWWLLETAWQAMLQRRKVAFFSIGDMSRPQIMRRFETRAAKRPFKAKSIFYPRSFTFDPDDKLPDVNLIEKKFTKSLNWRLARKAFDEIMKSKVKSKVPYLKLACYPNFTITAKGIENSLRSLERQGWVPDVVVIDYADNIAPMNGMVETRDQINTTWMMLRGISQKFHCALVTASQSDAASYKAITMDRSNFTNDKRKLAHVTGMIGINQTAEEKLKQIMRLNWIVLREEEYHEEKCIYVAGCLAIANPAIKSAFKGNKNAKKKEQKT